jgi:hypothetical protein
MDKQDTASGTGNSVAAPVRVAGVFILEEDPAKEEDQFDLSQSRIAPARFPRTSATSAAKCMPR